MTNNRIFPDFITKPIRIISAGADKIDAMRLRDFAKTRSKDNK